VVNIRTTERAPAGPLPFGRNAPALQQSVEMPRGRRLGFILSAAAS